MIVLHILLGILKAAGILLLVLLGILLLLLLALLFCPVGYGLQGKRDDAGCRGTAKVFWLFHLVSVKGIYRGSGGETTCTVRLLGIPLDKVTAFFGKRQNRKKDRKEADLPKHEPAQPKVSKEQTQDTREQAKAGEKQTESVSGFCKVRNFLKNFRLTWKKICAKMESIQKLLKSGQFQRGKALLLAELKKFFRRIRPGKVKGHVKFGLEDPCLTGELLGAAGIFYPLYGKYFTIEPYFERNIFQGNLCVKGRIYGIHFVLLAWNLFRSRDIRYLVKKIKTYF